MELYNFQQQLAKLQMTLEKAHEDFSSLNRLRQEAGPHVDLPPARMPRSQRPAQRAASLQLAYCMRPRAASPRRAAPPQAETNLSDMQRYHDDQRRLTKQEQNKARAAARGWPERPGAASPSPLWSERGAPCPGLQVDDLQAELDKLQLTLQEVEAHHERIKSDVAVKKRETYAAVSFHSTEWRHRWGPCA